MIGAPNTRGQKYWVGIVEWAPESSVSEEIADIFRNYNWSLVKHIGKSPHSWPKIVIHGNPCIIIYT